MDVANRIKAWRHSLGLTQEQFAALAAMPKRTLVGYENDEREPGATALAALARTGVNVNWLLTGEGEMRSAPALGEPAPPAYLAADHPQAERWRKLIELVDSIEDAERRGALLTEWFSRAQDASELMQIRRLLRDRKPAA